VGSVQHIPMDDGRTIFRAVAGFALSGLAVLVLVAVGGAWGLQRLGTAEAINDARRTTEIAGHGIVEPQLSAGVMAGRRNDLDVLDRIVKDRILGDRIVRVKIWSPDGRIIYSDEPRLIGKQFTLEPEHLEALNGGPAAAHVADLSHSENRFERRDGKVLEVYMGLKSYTGRPVLFEAYQRYSSVAGSGNTIWRLFAPLMIAALVVLAALQVPLAWRMARRVRDAQRDRETLLQNAIDASDAERRAIAAGLHDGVVQELAGLSFQMAAAVEQQPPEPETRRVLAQSAAGTRNAIRQLRSLLFEIYPPSLEDHGLGSALPDLASRLTARGTRVDVRVSLEDDLDPRSEQLVFRVAQEALRNVAKHADAQVVELSVARENGVVTLDVKDDGRGFDVAGGAGRPANGHIGLRLVNDLAASSGGRLDVTSSPGKGTHVHLELPVP
jgi:two-component system, NarL family, sensor kinase